MFVSGVRIHASIADARTRHVLKWTTTCLCGSTNCRNQYDLSSAIEVSVFTRYNALHFLMFVDHNVAVLCHEFDIILEIATNYLLSIYDAHSIKF